MVSNSRAARIATLLVCATFPPAVFAQNGSSSIGDLPDLDASVGFGTPRQVTILHAYDRTKNVFYIFPSAVDFVMTHNQASTVGLQIAWQRGTGGHGSFTFTVRPRFQNSEINKAVTELKGRYPKALFAFPVPSKARLSMSTIEQPSILFSPGEESSSLFNDIAFTAKLTPIESRFLQLPQSLDSPSATFQFAYSIRGVSREADGRAVVVERGYRLGGILNGFCAPFPKSTVEVSSGRTGCAYVSFDRALVKEIQSLLQRLKHFEGRGDGVFGPLTDAAIRSFQRSNKFFVTGYPTRELVDQIKAVLSTSPRTE